MDFLDKIKTIQISKVHHDRKGGKGFFKPPNPEKGEMGLLVPSFGILEQKEVDEIAGEALEKMAKEKRIQPSRTKEVHIEHRKGGEVIIEEAR